jgi:molecular chaperone DnaK
MGAAIQAGVLAGDVTGLVLLDVTPLSLGVEVYGGITAKIIERNTTIPTKKSQIFTTAADNQTSVDIHVLQGEREMAADNKTLGRFALDGIPPAPKQVPQIEVTFDIDANGIVNVTAQDKGTGKEQHITITASSNMSKEEVQKAVDEAAKYAEEDKKRREAVDTRNGADQLIYQCEKALKEMGDKLPAEEKAPIEEQIERLKSTVATDDTEAIKRETEELQQRFYKIAEKMYAQQQPQGDPNVGNPNGQAAAGDRVDVEDYKVDGEDNK